MVATKKTKNIMKGDTVMVKLGSKIPWRKAKVVKRRGNDVTIKGSFWEQGVTGTLNKKHVRFISR